MHPNHADITLTLEAFPAVRHEIEARHLNSVLILCFPFGKKDNNLLTTSKITFKKRGHRLERLF
jgi:hypothetical protein